MEEVAVVEDMVEAAAADTIGADPTDRELAVDRPVAGVDRESTPDASTRAGQGHRRGAHAAGLDRRTAWWHRALRLPWRELRAGRGPPVREEASHRCVRELEADRVPL